jgi:DNA-directed RNA polymerase specialized sigma24 family protein
MDADSYFAAEWPATAHRIGRSLARHGVAACDRDDILQETALRLYRAWSSVDPARGVEPFARTIALNLLRDNARRPGATGEVLGDVPDRPDSGDVVERTTIARLELGHVRRALTRLRPVEQRVLTDAVAAEITGDQSLAPAALRMARMRARRQLVAVLRAASAWAGVLAALGRGLRPGRTSRAAVAATAVAAVVAVSLLATPHQPAPRQVALGPGEAGDAANRADVSAVRFASSRPVVATSAVAPARANRRAARPASEPPYVHIDTPVARVDVLVSASLGDVDVEVRDRGTDVPFCVTTPLGSLDHSVDCD